MTLNKDNDFATALKILKRFRKVFLFKMKFYDIRQSGEITKEMKEDYNNLLIGRRTSEEGKNQEPLFDQVSEKERMLWFETIDKESFKAETSQFIRKLPFEEAVQLRKEVVKFEENFSGIDDVDSLNALYYTKYTNSVLKERVLKRNKYASLTRYVKSRFTSIGATSSDKALKAFIAFIENDFSSLCSSCSFESDNDKKIEDESDYNKLIFPNYASFIKYNSDEYKRRVLNAVFSIMCNVEPSDEVPFVKRNGGRIDYTIFRVLVWLRNISFNYDDFIHFISKLDAKELSNRMTIDYGLTNIIKSFIRNVKEPKRIDDLIITHRIVKGLWQNGSKFLNSYTLHNEDHAIKLIELSNEITTRIDYIKLKETDYYILFMACYLHDLSMVIHPDLQKFSHMDSANLNSMARHLSDMKDIAEGFTKLRKDAAVSGDKMEHLWKSLGNFMIGVFGEVYSYFEANVRQNHASDSAKFVISKANSLFDYIDPAMLSFIAKAGENHQKYPHDIFGLVSKSKHDTVGLKYISIVLRLADLLDVSNDRINYHLLNENVQHLPEDSKFHWISHLITDDIRLIPYYALDSEVVGKDAKGKDITLYFIQETLRFYLLLNVKSLDPVRDDTCEKCIDWYQEKYDIGEKDCPDIYKDYEGIKIIFGNRRCRREHCSMVCWWMKNKHEWLFRELKELEKYLQTVNHKPFRTRIEVNILFKDMFNIEPHLYDAVHNYLKNK